LLEEPELAFVFLIVFYVNFFNLEGLTETVVVVDRLQYLPVVAVVVPWSCLVLAQHLPFLRLFLIHL
jgi:hypothetical protein